MQRQVKDLSRKTFFSHLYEHACITVYVEKFIYKGTYEIVTWVTKVDNPVIR